MKTIDGKTVESGGPEPKRKLSNREYWLIWAFVALLWAGHLYFGSPDWGQIALGVITGGVLATWAIDITGDKLPAFMAPKDAQRRRPPLG